MTAIRLTLLPLDPRDTPTTLTLSVGDDPLGWWSPGNLAVADSAAAELSDRLDVPGHDVWRVELHSSTAAPLIAQATGVDGGGVVWVGPAVATVDQYTVMLHELAHTLGMRDHGTDPAGVLWPYIAPGEVRTWQASDDGLARAAGLVVVPAEGFDAVRTPSPELSEEVYPYTESSPYRGPLVRVACPWGPGWALVPPRVAEAWGRNVG